MAKVKVEVMDAVVDGNASGSTIEIDERSADRLVALGYVKYVETKPAQEASVKKESAPKKPAAKAKVKTTKE